VKLKLRTFLTVSASLLGLLGLLAALSLMWTTTLIGRANSQLWDAIESVRAAEELEMRLHLYEQGIQVAEEEADEVPDSQDHGRKVILRWLDRTSEHIGSAEERAMVMRLRREVEDYLTAEPAVRAAHFRTAIQSTEALSALNVARARVTRNRAKRIDQLANNCAVAVAVLLLAGIGLVIAAGRVHLYRPLVLLRKAIAGYGKGNESQPAVEAGPREIREIAAEFNDMAGRLASQRESQLQFVAGVAHDLRNPLHALKMSADLLVRSEELPANGRARSLLERISKQAARLNRMVADLLDRTRIEAGALDLQIEECDLCELAAEVVDLQRSTADAHVLDLAVPEKPLSLRCDASRMSQVLTNLVNNAIKYSPQGGRVRVTLARDDARALITVADEGVGIPAGECEHIFEPFRRSPNSKADIPGVGLGLSVSRRIVNAHGGHVRVTSVEGKGTTFHIELPLQILEVNVRGRANRPLSS
jgi:two-component system sensor histidine kinase MtrB